MPPNDSTEAWRHPDALARLEALFRAAPCHEAGLTTLFLDKYRHWFGPDGPALAKRLERRRRRLVRLVGDRCLRDARVLDVGAGFGFNALLAALAGAREVIAVDLRADRVADTSALAARAGLETLHAACEPYQRSMRECGPFDLVICSYFLSHLDADEEFLGLCRDAIAPGGKLYLADDNNALSPVRQLGVRAEWWRAELLGNRDNASGFLATRRSAIDEALARAGRGGTIAREYCAWATRGMTLDQCRDFARAFAGEPVPKPPRPPFAYRDPANGIAEERLLNPLRLAGSLRSKGFDVALFPPRPGSGEDRIARLLAALSSEFELVATRRA